LAALAPDIELESVVGGRVEEVVQRDPASGRDFRIGRERGSGWEREDERADSDRRENGGPGNDIVEAADELLAGGRIADLLRGLPDGGGDEVRVDIRLASAGERHVSRPRVVPALGPADQEEAVGIGSEEHRDGRPDERAARGVYLGLVVGEALPETEESRGQCWWP
jgi:hypothetical protein